MTPSISMADILQPGLTQGCHWDWWIVMFLQLSIMLTKHSSLHIWLLVMTADTHQHTNINYLPPVSGSWHPPQLAHVSEGFSMWSRCCSPSAAPSPWSSASCWSSSTSWRPSLTWIRSSTLVWRFVCMSSFLCCFSLCLELSTAARLALFI